MQITILTLFPEMFPPVLNASILGRAVQKGLVRYKVINIRNFGIGPHKSVDDKPYGGGVGMVLRADVLDKALGSVMAQKNAKTRVVLLSASGTTLKQEKCHDFSRLDHLILICGHYEGVDQRFIDLHVDEEISIGDYVLTGGEIPAMVVVDSVVRLIPKVLEKEEAIQKESFQDNLLEHPHYTRPAVFQNLKVPQVLLSGDHKKIGQWREEQSKAKTKKLRPDSLEY